MEHDRGIGINHNRGDTTMTQSITTIDPSAVRSITSGEIDVQIATAKKYPRDVRAAQRKIVQMATMDRETAKSCTYVIPRGQEPITGPTIRLAEIVINQWPNCRAGSRVLEIGDSFVVAQGVFHDLETNVLITQEVRRRITSSSGQRFRDDMIGVTANAACAVVFRNVVFAGVPRLFWLPAWEAAQTEASCKEADLEEERVNMVAAFGGWGVGVGRILSVVNRTSLDQVTTKDVDTLRGIYRAIKDKDTTVEDAFPTEGGGAAGLADKLDKLESSAVVEALCPNVGDVVEFTKGADTRKGAVEFVDRKGNLLHIRAEQTGRVSKIAIVDETDNTSWKQWDAAIDADKDPDELF
jgi:hypothetical protein